MRLEKDKLINQLEMVRAGLSSRELIEQSSCFVFHDGYVLTFNDEIACRIKTDMKIEGAVQASRLLAILEKLDDPELDLRENEANELEFKAKRKLFGMTKEAEIFLPIDQVETPGEWITVPKDFAAAVGKLKHCVSTDASKFELTCIHITPKFMEACDNLQLMRFKCPSDLERPVLVRGATLSQMISLGMHEMSLTKSWLHFRNEAGLVLSCRAFAEDYHDLGPLLKVEGGSELKLSGALKEASERAAVFAADIVGDPFLEVTLKEGKCIIKGQGLTGWYKEQKAVHYDGPAMKFIISPALLDYVTQEHKDVVISDTKLKAKGANWAYVTVLGSKEEAESE